ncbi:unnamed protein product, partial [Phaeothamnion confervicola]
GRPPWQRGRLLVLAGPPGIGKSMMLRVLSDEIGLQIVEWLDTSGQASAPYRGGCGGGGGGDGDLPTYSRHHALGSMHSTQIEQFDDFMRAAAYPSLGIAVGEAAAAAAAPPVDMGSAQDTAAAMKTPWTVAGKAVAAAGAGAAATTASPMAAGKAAGKMAGGPASGASSGSSGRGMLSAPQLKRLVMIEELPSTGQDSGSSSEEKAERMRVALVSFLAVAPCPVALVLSESSDRGSHMHRLEKLLSREVAYSPLLHVIVCNPVNATILRKHLHAVLDAEGVQANDLVEETILSCGGDIRHALLTLQVRAGHQNIGGGSCGGSGGGCGAGSKGAGKGKGKAAASRAAAAAGRGVKAAAAAARAAAVATARRVDAEDGGAAGSGRDRDVFLSHFHALGKLLYCKRLDPAGNPLLRGGGDNGAAANGVGGGSGDAAILLGPLTFVPEDVLERSNMSVDRAAAFLQYHCTDFYTDCDQLAAGLRYMSDADLFVAAEFDPSGMHDRSGDGEFPSQYAASMAGRAIAATNRRPAPNRLRAFGAPKTFEMMRMRRTNADVVGSFAWRAVEEAGLVWAVRNPSEIINTDYVPAVRVQTGIFPLAPALDTYLRR